MLVCKIRNLAGQQSAGAQVVMPSIDACSMHVMSGDLNA